MVVFYPEDLGFLGNGYEVLKQAGTLYCCRKELHRCEDCRKLVGVVPMVDGEMSGSEAFRMSSPQLPGL